MISRDRNAGRMDLRKAGVREVGAFFVRPIDCGDIAPDRAGGQIKNIGIATCRQHDRIGRV